MEDAWLIPEVYPISWTVSTEEDVRPGADFGLISVNSLIGWADLLAAPTVPSSDRVETNGIDANLSVRTSSPVVKNPVPGIPVDWDAIW